MDFLGKVVENILNPVILLLFGFAVIVFLWGVLQFVLKADSEEGRVTGGKHILYGIIGMAIMISAFGIMRFIIGTIGAEDTVLESIEP